MCLYLHLDANTFRPMSVLKMSPSVYVCACTYIHVCFIVCQNVFTSVFAPISLSVKPALRLPRPEMTDRVGCNGGDRGRAAKTLLHRNCVKAAVRIFFFSTVLNVRTLQGSDKTVKAELGWL